MNVLDIKAQCWQLHFTPFKQWRDVNLYTPHQAPALESEGSEANSPPCNPTGKCPLPLRLLGEMVGRQSFQGRRAEPVHLRYTGLTHSLQT